MKNVLIAAAAAATLAATPALASDFTGPRIEATAGYQDVTNNRTNLTYGANAGYDIKVVGPVRAGVEVGVDNVFDRRNLNAGARLGLVLSSHALAYAKISYSNYRDINLVNLDGCRLGGGLELKVAGPVYTKVEYRHADFGSTKSNDAIAGIGLRF